MDQSHRNNQRRGKRGGLLRGMKGAEHGLPGIVFAGIATGIGLASESIHHHKEKKAAKKATEGEASSKEDDLPPPYTEQSNMASQPEDSSSEKANAVELLGEKLEEIMVEEDDEEQWDLDDAQDGLIPEPAQEQKRKMESSPKKIIAQFFERYPIPQNPDLPRGMLPLPVVLPQRRPMDRTRGFIRAYAPDLACCGIDQAMFLDFLQTFNEASAPNPLLEAVNLAGLAFIALPLGISQAAAIALAITVAVAKNMQSRARYNSFLDQINDGFFRPRGLFCMVLTWNPESDALHTSVNINETIASNIPSPSPAGILDKTKHSLRASMGNTVGLAFTETAPLVFPALDKLAGQNTEEAKTTMNKLASAKKFTGDYFDRRAQAQYAMDHPKSQLAAGPKPEFTSAYADPHNAAASGSLVGLVTGGKYSLPGRGGLLGLGLANRGRRRRMESERRHARTHEGQRMDTIGGHHSAGGLPPPLGGIYNGPDAGMRTNQQQQEGRGRSGLLPGVPRIIGPGIRRILAHHVLYLLIVNMPSVEEMSTATQAMDDGLAEMVDMP